MTAAEAADERDQVAVFQDDSGEWRWHRRAAGNFEIIADSGEGYTDRRDAIAGAIRTNMMPYDLDVAGQTRGVDITIDTTTDEPAP